MRRILLVFVVALAACGSGSRDSSRSPSATTPPAPATTIAGGSGGAPIPDAARQQMEEALRTWAEFPVDASPRPLVLTAGAVSDPAHGFHTDNDKLAYISGAFAAPATLPSGPQGAAGYPVVTAAQALAVLRAQGNPDSRSPSPPAPLVITDVRFGSASFDTDRGARVLPAWLFLFEGVDNPAAVLAVAPSARFPASAGELMPSIGAQLAPEGRRATITFVGGAAGNGPCTADYTVDQLASDAAVAVRVRETANRGGTCASIGYDRRVTIVLGAPLGERVLVDAATKAAVAVTP